MPVVCAAPAGHAAHVAHVEGTVAGDTEEVVGAEHVVGAVAVDVVERVVDCVVSVAAEDVVDIALAVAEVGAGQVAQEFEG